MRRIFKKGNVENFPFDLYKNFCYEFDDLVKFEVSFLNDFTMYIYGFEFASEDKIGEYLFENNKLLFSRDLNGSIEGEFINFESFKVRMQDLPLDKPIVPNFLEYTKVVDEYKVFKLIDKFFNKMKFVDNGRNKVYIPLYNKFIDDQKKMLILNKLISSTQLYIKKETLYMKKSCINLIGTNRSSKIITLRN
jgi:hypothetical protein